jgi:hypothetical protein
MEQKRNEYRIVVGKLEEMRPQGRSKRRWNDNIVACRPVAKR